MVSRIKWICGSSLVCALLMGGVMLAQAQQERRRERSSAKTEVRTEERSRSTTEVRRISTVVGGTVQFASGGTVGRIEDIIISDSGCIDYVIVAYRDVFVPIPWTIAVVDFDKRIVRIDIDKDRFDEVPTFTKDKFAVLAEADFTKKVHSFFRVDSNRRESRTRESDTRRERVDDRAKDRSSDRREEDRPAPRGKAKDKEDDSKRKEPKKEKEEKDKEQKDEKKPG